MPRIFLFLAITIVSAAVSFGAEYKGPSAIAATKDGSMLYIANFDAGEVAVVSTANNSVIKTIEVGTEPTGITLSPDGAKAFITTGAARGVVQILDTASGKIEKEAKTGHTPMGPVVSPDGKKLYVCNRFSTDIVEFSLPDLKEVRRFPAVREPKAAAITPDGKTVFALNHIPNDPSDSFDVASEVTCIDTESGKSENIRLPNGSGSMHDLVVSPDGKYLFLTEVLARYQMPTTQVERGWMNTNAISIIDVESKKFVNTVLLDDVDLGAANPWGIACSPDGKQLYIALSGTHEICVVDVEGMMDKLTKSKSALEVPNDLAFLVGLKKRIKLSGKGPRAIVWAAGNVWTGMYYADTLLKVDPSDASRAKIDTILLGPEPDLTPERRGEIHWNDATLCFQHWQSCATCHPDARIDAYNWDLLNDGLGNPKNAKSILNCNNTPPAMWHGVRASSEIAVGTGFKFIHFAVRTKEEVKETEAYLASLKQVESPHLVNGEMSEAAVRGLAVFEDKKVGCAVCHNGPYFTDQKMHDVGTKASIDRKSEFDTPSLNECWRTAPYLHDGRYVKMRDVFKIGHHGDVEGDIEGLSDKQIDDLCEYILSL